MSHEGERPTNQVEGFDTPEQPAIDTEQPTPEYHTDIEQAQLNDFSKRYGEHLFRAERDDKGARESQARELLNQSLLASLVFNVASRQLRQEGITEPIDQVADPMKRLEAIQAAQRLISNAVAFNEQRNQEDHPDLIHKYRAVREDMAFCQYLVNGVGENKLRSRFGLLEFEYGKIPPEAKQFLTEHLNEINLVNLAKEQDDAASKAGHHGRVYGRDFFNGGSRADRGEWLPKLMTMNGFEAGTGLLLPEGMSEDEKDKYLAAFEQYRDLFTEKNTSERQRLNDEQIQKIEKLESLITEYEETDQLMSQRDDLKSEVIKTQSQYESQKDLLTNAKNELRRQEMLAAEANFLNRGSRSRAVEDQIRKVHQLEDHLTQWAQHLADTESKHQKAQNADHRKLEIERELQQHTNGRHPDTIKQHVEELKKQPKY